MIVVTGVAGFIGSCLVKQLNENGIDDIVIVDDFSNKVKNRNLERKIFKEKIEREVFIEWFRKNAKNISFVFHIGARTDTTEFDYSIFESLNLNYSKQLWAICTEHHIPLVYASSAATYGEGELGYDDDEKLIPKLQPLNPYGVSKNEFDKWVLQQKNTPLFWCGLKFFNVYGPNEYHKARMASVIFHANNQITATGKVKLFRSHRPDYKDGMQLRDFIYVKDVLSVCLYFLNNQKHSGIYNLGTGKARTFLDLANAVFAALNLPAQIEFIDTPQDIRDKYQYFTEAKMVKLIKTGYTKEFTSLENGVADYVKKYLLEKRYF
jgi:ADP-L-glycero-D-manno-heptose 6-epimerase